MEEKQFYCEEHNVYHIGTCPICKKEELYLKYQQETYTFLLVLIGFLACIALIIFVIANM